MNKYTGNYFRGERVMQGHGLGALFSGIFRTALPFIKSGIGYLGKNALRTGADMMGEILDGAEPKKAFKNNIKKMSKSMINDVKVKLSGNGSRKRKRKTVDKSNKRKRGNICKSSTSRIMLY